jgi:16S rRNA (guanine527-N7)-methyltransferase
MNRTRIVELLQPFLAAPLPNRKPAVLTNTQLDDISTYIDILTRWNAHINLTAIREPEEIVTRHFGESLFAARILFPNTSPEGTAVLARPTERSSAPATRDDRGRAALQGREKGPEDIGASAPEVNDQRPTTNDVADIGSGAGFPGIPLKLWNPAIHLTLIESNHKKATFLREIVRALTLTDINIQNTRAETLPPASFDLVTLRAVERFESILPTSAALLTPRARLALLIGADQADQACRTLPELTWSNPIRVPQSQSRILLIGTRLQGIKLVTSGT